MSGDHSSSPTVTRGVQQPTRGPRPGQPKTPPYLALLRVGFSLPVVSPRRRCALTAPFHPYHPRTCREFGGVFSVALSLRFPPLAVNQHTALRSPDFPPRLTSSRGDRPTASADTRRLPFLATRVNAPGRGVVRDTFDGPSGKSRCPRLSGGSTTAAASRPSPGRSRTARASCRGSSVACRSPSPWPRCSSGSRGVSAPGKSARQTP